jgi:hypothetical protein
MLQLSGLGTVIAVCALNAIDNASRVEDGSEDIGKAQMGKIARRMERLSPEVDARTLFDNLTELETEVGELEGSLTQIETKLWHWYDVFSNLDKVLPAYHAQALLASLQGRVRAMLKNGWPVVVGTDDPLFFTRPMDLLTVFGLAISPSFTRCLLSLQYLVLSSGPCGKKKTLLKVTNKNR